MRRAIIALLTATTLVLTGLTLSPLRATALGQTSVTLNCSDNTSLTLLVDADGLAALTSAVQGMIDYPAGLSCTLVQNPLPLTTSFGHLALAATDNRFVVAGGRWQVPCAEISFPSETLVPYEVARNGANRPTNASIMAPAPLSSSTCDNQACIWVNIAVNVHFRDGTTILEGTLNETIPANQFCPNNPAGANVDIGPSHFDSKPTGGCLDIVDRTAAVTTLVTQISGQPFPSGAGTGINRSLAVNDPVNFSFIDNGNPGDANPKDQLSGPPWFPNDSACPAHATVYRDLVDGNISVHGP